MTIWSRAQQVAIQAPPERNRYVDFLRRVGAPLTLSEAGVPDDPASLDKYADHAGEAGGSFVQIHRDDARAILEACKEPVSF